MKNSIFTFILVLFMFSFMGCITEYIPVESVKTEYINRVELDTVIINNDNIVREKGDTVFITNTKYIYKTKSKTDTILKIDSIPIIQEVEVIKEVNILKDWQLLLMIFGGIAITVVGYKFIKKVGL